MAPAATAVALLCAEDTSEAGNVNNPVSLVAAFVTVFVPVAMAVGLVADSADDALGGIITIPDPSAVVIDDGVV